MKSVDYRETLFAYLYSENIEAASTNLHISVSTLMYRLKKLRDNGVKVPLKEHAKKDKDEIRTSELNNMITKYKKEMQK